MKTIFVVLLIAAFGAGAYFYFTKKQKSSPPGPKELIVGKWKIDSFNLERSHDSSLAFALLALDSNLHCYEFEIGKGLVIQTLNGKEEDTSHYEFTDDKQLLLWNKTDTSKTKWTINKLDSLSLVVQDKDSTVFCFERIVTK